MLILLSDGAPAQIRTADLLITNQLLKFKQTFICNNNLKILLNWQQSGNNDKVFL